MLPKVDYLCACRMRIILRTARVAEEGRLLGWNSAPTTCPLPFALSVATRLLRCGASRAGVTGAAIGLQEACCTCCRSTNSCSVNEMLLPGPPERALRVAD